MAKKKRRIIKTLPKPRTEYQSVVVEESDKLLSSSIMWLIGFFFAILLYLGTAVFFLRIWER